MAENKYLSLTGLQSYDAKLKALMLAKDAENLDAAKAYADSLADNYEAAGSVASAKAELNAKIQANTDAIGVLNGDANTAGSVDKKIADAKGELNTTITNLDKKVDGVQGEVDAAEERITNVEAKADANEAKIGNLDNLNTTAKEDLVKALNEVKTSVAAGGEAAAITIDTSSTTNGMLKSYTIKQGDDVVGTIDIPKDMVVEDGQVVVNPEGMDAGTYIELKLANVTEPLYINVGTLVDIYKAKANATQVQVSIDSATREISAVIVAGSIGTTELADDAVTTAKIANANVTKEKLSTAVQASLNKADVAEANAKAYADGLNTEMAERMAAAEEKLGTGTGSVAENIATAKSEAIAAAAADATAKADAAEDNANAYTDEKVAANKKLIDANTAEISALKDRMSGAETDIDNLQASLATGGATANAIADAKKAGTDAQAEVDALEERVADLESIDFVEITTSEIDAMFAA